jgi:hypothetical protein
MRKLLPFVETYLRDSQHVLNICADISPLRPSARLFTADEIAMFTNIEPEVDIRAIFDFIASVGDRLPSNLPSQVVDAMICVIMPTNVFQLDDTFW